jgi:hypothetical protein
MHACMHARTHGCTGAPVRRPRAFVHACICALLAAVLLVHARPLAADDEVIDRVLAVAGGDVITLSDLRAAQKLGRVDVSNAADPVRTALTQLIDRALVLAEVDRFGPPDPPASAIDAALAEVIARFPSPPVFDAALREFGIDRQFVRALLREDLRIRAYLDLRFAAETADERRTMVDQWVAGLRRRADVVDLYGPPVSAPGSGTGPPARD